MEKYFQLFSKIFSQNFEMKWNEMKILVSQARKTGFSFFVQLQINGYLEYINKLPRLREKSSGNSKFWESPLSVFLDSRNTYLTQIVRSYRKKFKLMLIIWKSTDFTITVYISIWHYFVRQDQMAQGRGDTNLYRWYRYALPSSPSLLSSNSLDSHL